MDIRREEGGGGDGGGSVCGKAFGGGGRHKFFYFGFRFSGWFTIYPLFLNFVYVPVDDGCMDTFD